MAGVVRLPPFVFYSLCVSEKWFLFRLFTPTCGVKCSFPGPTFSSSNSGSVVRPEVHG